MNANKALYFCIITLLTVTFCQADITPDKLAAIKAKHGQDMQKLCRSGLQKEDAFDLQFAFSAFYLNEQTDQANARLKNAYKELLKDDAKMTPEVAERFKWQMRWWLRIYYLFNNGRGLSDANEQMLEELFYNYACRKSTVKRADLKYIWIIQGSENHDMMDLSNAFLSLQAIKDMPQFAAKKLLDGHTVHQHYHHWLTYYQEYCRQRALKGFYVEVASPTYGKYFMPELINIFDFAEDAQLKQLMTKLLHVTWADWAVDQINGIRGGGRTRAYQGSYSCRGTSDSWWAMSKPLIGDSSWTDASQHNHINNGFAYVLGSSSYRLPNLVLQLALDHQGRGDYENISHRPAKMHYSPDRPRLMDDCWYDLDMEDPHAVRYNYCTPNYIIGSWWIDPTFTTVFRVDEKTAAETPTSYSALFSQNRWQGVIFDTDLNARVYPQCLGTERKDGSHSITYNQHQAVQAKNIMLVQKNKNNKSAKLMRIYWAKGMKGRLEKSHGYWILQEGDSYLAVKAFSLTQPNAPVQERWADGNWLEISQEYAPVVFVTGRKSQYKTLDIFTDYLKGHTYKVDKDRFNYRGPTCDGDVTELTLFANNKDLAQINNLPINLKLKTPYSCPYLSCDQKTKTVTIRYGNQKMVLEFDK